MYCLNLTEKLRVCSFKNFDGYEAIPNSDAVQSPVFGVADDLEDVTRFIRLKAKFIVWVSPVQDYLRIRESIPLAICTLDLVPTVVKNFAANISL